MRFRRRGAGIGPAPRLDLRHGRRIAEEGTVTPEAGAISGDGTSGSLLPN